MEGRPKELTPQDGKRGAQRGGFRAGARVPGVRPAQVTLTSFAVGLLAVTAFAATDPLIVALGLLGFHLHVMLDYVDGEVARCRGTTSVKGAYFDLITDRV